MVPLLFVVGITMGSFGSILMKTGASQIGPHGLNSFAQAVDFLFRLFTNIPILCGISLYFLSAVVWTYLLTKLDISFVQPILALTYVATPILAIFLLHEHVPAMRWVGILIIIAGVFVVARTST